MDQMVSHPKRPRTQPKPTTTDQSFPQPSNYRWVHDQSRTFAASPVHPHFLLEMAEKEQMTEKKPAMEKGQQHQEKMTDELADALNDLFVNISSMVKSELQGSNNLLELLEKMNLRVAEEYTGFGDVASGLRVFVEQLKCKSGNFDEYIQQIDTIEQQVTEFEAVISMLDKYVSLLESKVQSVYSTPPM
ncbi:Biogenesis of lysosome-related organelles complex-1, subunit 2 [Dillenia turbinata]|uniref:Biogenesis of lysosome-related organelles complex-1, subunit 2 n=1 Tax=Dillenia turbinata TaxID=194707 RepID=A0AAN8VHJ9_9MAGN